MFGGGGVVRVKKRDISAGFVPHMRICCNQADDCRGGVWEITILMRRTDTLR